MKDEHAPSRGYETDGSIFEGPVPFPRSASPRSRQSSGATDGLTGVERGPNLLFLQRRKWTVKGRSVSSGTSSGSINLGKIRRIRNAVANGTAVIEASADAKWPRSRSWSASVQRTPLISNVVGTTTWGACQNIRTDSER